MNCLSKRKTFNRYIAYLLLVVMIFIGVPIPVHAAPSVFQVVLDTDKDSYTQGETVAVSVGLKDTNIIPSGEIDLVSFGILFDPAAFDKKDYLNDSSAWEPGAGLTESDFLFMDMGANEVGPTYTPVTGVKVSPSSFNDIVSFNIDTKAPAAGYYDLTIDPDAGITFFGDTELVYYDNDQGNVDITTYTKTIHIGTAGAAPVNLAGAGSSFVDSDTDPGEIGGAVDLVKATDESDITEYAIYFLKADNTKASGQVITHRAAEGANMSVAIGNDVKIPEDATKLGIYSANNHAESSLKTIIPLTDTGAVVTTKSLKSYDPVTLTQTGDVANNNVQYGNAVDVITALPSTIEVTLEDDTTKVNVPVTWTDTDAYNAGTADSYTFTATWGAMPEGADNDDSIAAPTVELVVAQGVAGSTKSLKTYTPVTFTQTGDIANNNVQYANAAAVIAALPSTIEVTLEDDTTKVNVPVIWLDTDSYDAGTAASYTFTATWGVMPAEADNADSIAAPTVEVTVAAGVVSTKSVKTYTPVTFTQTGDIANNNVQYANAAAVIAALPATIEVTLEDDTTKVNVPVTWADTDSYDAGTAASYTFTATWGAMPAGSDNADSIAAPTVEVTVAAGVAPTKSLKSFTPVTFTQTGDIANNNVQYANAAAVLAALPATIEVTLEDDTTKVNVPVTWADTDSYDAGTAASYTFTATWGATPAGSDNADSIAAPTVEVTVAAGVAPTKSLKSFTPVTFTQTGDIANNNVQYANAATVLAALPATIEVTLEDDTTKVNVPVTWADTDSYNAGVAGSYTFTATWGAMPAGADNADSIAAPTVEVTVAAGVAALPTISGATISAITTTTAKLSFTPSVNGKYYYMVMNNSAVPTIPQLKAQSLISGAVTCGTGAAIASTNIDVDINGLSPFTSQYYSAYFILEDDSLNTSSITSIDDFRTMLLPTFTIEQILTNSVKLKLDIPANCTQSSGNIYYVVLADGASAPSAIQIKAGQDSTGNSAGIKGNTPYFSRTVTATINTLNPSTSYDLYTVVADGNANPAARKIVSEIVKIDFTTATPDVTAPTLSDATASTITNTTTTLNFTSDEAGTYYYLVYAAADAAPNAATIKLQGTAVAKGTAAASAAANTANVTGLTASTAYKAYVIVEDAASNSSAVSTITFSTNAAALPTMGGTVTIDGTVKYGQTLTANITGITYSSGTPADVPTYQWKRDGVDITGATNSTYTLVESDIEAQITVTVTADGTNATGSSTSTATGAVVKADGPALAGVSANDTTNTMAGMSAAMEFSTNGTDWTAYNGSNLPNLTGTVALQVRVAATATENAGAATTFNFTAGAVTPTISSTVSAITTTSAKLSFTSNVNGKVFYKLVRSGFGISSIYELKLQQLDYGTATYGSINISDSTNLDIDINGLSPYIGYQIFYIVEDESQNASTLKDEFFRTLLSPTYTIEQISTNSAKLKLDISNDQNQSFGNVYYVVSASGASTPSAMQVKARQDSTGTTAAINGTFEFEEKVGDKTITGLSPNTTYNLFAVATNALDVIISDVVKKEFKTYADLTDVTFSAITGLKQGNANVAPGASVGTLGTIGGAPAITYGFETTNGTNNSEFIISGSSILVSGSALTAGTKQICVRATDGALTSVTKVFNITIAAPAPSGSGGGGGGGAAPVPETKGSVTIEEVTKQIEKVLGNLDKNNSSEPIKVTLNTNVATAKNGEQSIILPAGAMELAQDKGIDTITLVFPKESLNVMVDPEAFAKQTKSKELEFRVVAVEKKDIPASAANQLPNGTEVLSIKAYIGNAQVNTFKKPIQVGVPYTLKTGELPNMVAVYYIKDNGTLEKVGGTYDSKLKKVFFSTNHLSMYVAMAAEPKSFTDLEGYESAQSAIYEMSAKGYVNGTSETTFSPGANITRAEASAILVRMLKYTPSNNVMTFKDVTTDKWFYNEVKAAFDNGLIQGRSVDNFDTGANISKIEMASIIGRILSEKGYKLSESGKQIEFTDNSAVPTWGIDNAKLVVEKGIMNSDNGQFNPNYILKRADVAQILRNLNDILK